MTPATFAQAIKGIPPLHADSRSSSFSLNLFICPHHRSAISSLAELDLFKKALMFMGEFTSEITTN
jgi:hypothetical protein